MEYFQSKNKIGQFTFREEIESYKLKFQGHWFIGPESPSRGRTTDNYEDYSNIVYSTTPVNTVLTSGSREPYKVGVTTDAEYLTDENKGIVLGDDGESYLLVTTPTLYNMINNDSYVRRETLEMSSHSLHFGLFAFTFGIYDTGS